MSQRLFRFELWAVSGLILVNMMSGQEFRGHVQGRVSDPSGAAIPGASVKLVNVGTNVAANQTTNDTGLYRFDQVDPGNYTLTAEAPGFARYLQQTFAVQSQADLTIDVAMKTGNVQE